MRQAPRLTLLWMTLAGTIAGAVGAPPAEDAQEARRAAFREAYAAAELGEWAPAAANAALLEDYVLWPDLRAAFLRTQIGKAGDTEILAFIDRHAALRPARDLRYRYLLYLAEAERHAEYLALYRRHYERRRIDRLDCHAARAQQGLGAAGGVTARVRELWLVGRSQDAACDPVFARLRQSGAIDRDLHLRRYHLAVHSRQFRLARYLAKSIDEAHLAEAERWLAAESEAETFLAQADRRQAGAVYARQLAYAVRRLALRDPAAAARHWRALESDFRFTAGERLDTARHVALWMARLDAGDARRALDALDEAAVDAEVRRWRVRAALRDSDWLGVADAIGELPASERQEEVWRYWLARALAETGRRAEAERLLADLAGQRSYYGFLAADALGTEYRFGDADVVANETLIERLAGDPALIRARELYLVGLDGKGRAEWDAAVRALDRSERRQAAVLAHRWGWHSRAIATLARTGDYDDLAVRYPLPYREPFESSSAAAGIPQSWAYGVARSESLFMRDIRSGAGAIGVMQLLPSTGSRTAREIGAPYAGQVTLIDPESNIRLGTHYLAEMQVRFDGNAILATAAYNAGPGRVEEWLPARGIMDARVWLETIPFGETRGYVRRVIAADVIFHWRLTGETRRIGNYLSAVRAAPAPAPAAAL